MSAENPAVAALLDTPELTGNELAMRLFWWVGHLATLVFLESRCIVWPVICHIALCRAPERLANPAT